MPKNGKFDIVTGCARSGTSCVMLCLKLAGVQIGGFKYPAPLLNEKGMQTDGGLALPQPHMVQRNPKGLWEYTSIATKGIKSIHQHYDGDVVKVLTQALIHCDPDYVNRCLLVIRNPRSIVVSMKGQVDIDSPDNIDWYIYSLIHNTITGLRWLQSMNRNFKIIIYEELLANPYSIVEEMCVWLDHGNPKWGVHGVDKALNRSKPYGGDSEALREADTFYDSLNCRNLEKLYAYDLKALGERIDKVYVKMQSSNNPKGG